MKNILYILDDKVDIKAFIGYIEGAKPAMVYVCPLTVDNELARSIKDAISEYGNVKILDFVKRTNADE